MTSSLLSRRARAVAALAATAVFALTACSSSTDHESADGATTSTTASPQRIAAISPDAAETVAELGAGDRLVLVPDSQTKPALTNHLPVMQSVGATIAAHGAADPEQIIATDPDLVIITPRHEGETDVAALLAHSSVPVLTLPNSWRTVDEMVANIRLIGDAIGTPDEAAALADSITRSVDAITPMSGRAPSVLVLSNQAGRPMVNAGSGFTLDLVRRAGGTNAADAIGLQRTGVADPEQIALAGPDAILLVDMRGAGRESFASVLNHPALAELAAVQEDRVLLLPGVQTQAMGLNTVPTGLQQMHDWLAGLA
ncbi:ABC transporter substrate-binding protein [Prescottella agglutinans]|uniref:Iron complex transport system substrate-binding protein n=1 Tax=Prescottella agglutinans TaxID=1644129 RepID=A0ABT6MCX4_9NOCA|nr:ABC transporter substrate-binding protein [Prescottella agglutinans]MDH6282168.1 iron complex transport system substrate-binding protein [Prescottella agglutinans]